MSAPVELWSIEAEQAILGTLFISDRPMYALVLEEGLKPDDFYRPRHKLIWSAMVSLYDAGEPVERISVVDWLSARGELEQAGGNAAIDELHGPVPHAANVRQYARIVRSHAKLRRLDAAAAGIRQSIGENRSDPDALVQLAESAVLEVTGGERQARTRHVGDLLSAETDKLHAIEQGGGELLGVPSGWQDLDAITGGFQGGQLIVLGARPSMGKSCWVTNVAETVALSGAPALLFSLEMGESEIAQRFLASQARIPGNDLRHGRVGERWPQVVDASNRLAAAPLYTDDSSDMSVTDIRAKARWLHQKHGPLGLIIVDYLQLIRPAPGIESRVQQVGEMSRGLKVLARELNVPVIALSQLSRAVEQRTDKRPILSDLRDSGNVEQDADIVLFLYRDEYYDKDTEDQGLAELIVAKHRNGGLGTVKLVFLDKYPKFMTYAKREAA